VERGSQEAGAAFLTNEFDEQKTFPILKMTTQMEFFQLSMPEQVKLFKEYGTQLTSIGNNADEFRLFHFNVIAVENKEGEVI
jgi:hypothetical protein